MAAPRIIPATGNNPLGSGYGPVVPVELPPGSAPRFADNRGKFHTITIDLSVPRNNARQKVTGDVLWAYEATDNTAVINVKFNEQLGEGINYRQGLVIAGGKFDDLYLTNTAQAGKSITLLYGVQIAGNWFFQNFAQSFATVNIAVGATFTTVADVACANAANTVLAVANANRKELIISSPAGAGGARINDGGGAEGIWIFGGQTIVLSTTAQVSLRNDSGAAINMGVTEIAA